MPSRTEIRNIFCPANTPQSSALETDLTFPAGNVQYIEIRIPAGHSFLTGIALAQAHGIVIPDSGLAWIQGDDDRLQFERDGDLNNGSWSAFTFNLDPYYQHGWQVRFHINELPRNRPRRTVQGLPLEALQLEGL